MQLNAIKEELGERDDLSNEDDDITDLTKRIKEAGLTPEGSFGNIIQIILIYYTKIIFDIYSR